MLFDGDRSLHDADLIDLLLARSKVDAELQRRFKTKNIVGIYGEHLVAHALGGWLEPNSNYGFDVTLVDGRTVQVKTRMLTSATVQTGERSAGDFKADQNGWPFDLAACVLLDHATWQPVLAFTLPAHALPASGRGVQMRPPWSNHSEAVDLLPLIDMDALHAAIGAAVTAAPSGVVHRAAPSRTRSSRRTVRFVVNGRPQPSGRETLGWVAQHPARMPVDELRALVRAVTGVTDPDRQPWRITLPSGHVIEAIAITDE